jgi:exonuclease III
MPQDRVRLLSFNVNGLRACLKRLGVTLSQLLDILGAGK